MKRILWVTAILLTKFCMAQKDILYSSNRFTVFKNKVIQGNNIATAESPVHIKSNYKSPASTQFSRLVVFKLSINEKDNELPVGQNHWIIINNEQESPVIDFGSKPASVPDAPNSFLPVNYPYTFKVDVSSVLKQFESKGYYETFDGSKVAKNDFKGFYIAGASNPLTWDFVNLQNRGLKLQPTKDPNIYSLTVVFNPYNDKENEIKEWKLKSEVTAGPKYKSEQPLVDALFNMSLEEAKKNIEADSTLRTGAKWDGVWTRDVSYSTLLAFAYHAPEMAMISLRKKVKRGRIIQDTGSGGAWPVSSDRTTWILAAWEIFKITGDRNWLNEIYPIIKNTLEDDYKTIYDSQTGLYSGESSFLDWREQTYPKWVDNKDIYVSQNLGTNAVHYQAHRIMATMAKMKNEPSAVYIERAEKIKKGINTYLWMKDKGYYAQYRYGRNDLMISSRMEALGEALTILFDIADKTKAASIISKSPVPEFGVTCIYPQIPGIPPYHNNAIWPFVQSYWNWAAAKTGNEAALNFGLASIYRPAALFLTNYENMVAETGDFLGTEINSDRMLWSIAGNLAMVHRVFMGMDFQTDGLYFNPVVPSTYVGQKSLSHFKYRNAVLNITVTGFGNVIQKVIIDGQPVKSAFVPASLKGEHDIIITLANNSLPYQTINKAANYFTLPTVLAEKEGATMKWIPVPGARDYKIYKNGRFLKFTKETELKTTDEAYAAFQISAVDTMGIEGFASEPIVYAKHFKIIEIEDHAPASTLPYTNYSGKGFVECNVAKQQAINVTIDIEKAGNYLLDLRYSNGSGPWNTNNKCAIRNISINKKNKGVIVMPQRGENEWSDWGFSNSLKVNLQKGKNELIIHFENWNHNMNVDTNTAMLDYIRLIQLQE